MAPSYAFLVQPETNGVVGGFFRTLKEQVVRGRVFEILDDLRDAVCAVIARYNAEWLTEKKGYLSLQALRQQHGLVAIPIAA